MATEISMPKLGLTMNSGSVQQWNKKVGDSVSKGELLYVVATDKLSVDVESPADGVLLAIVVEEGKDVPVGEVLAYIGQAGEAVPAAPASTAPTPTATPAAAAAAPVQAAVPAAAPAPSGGGRVPSSPKAKKLAREKGLDVNSLNGTGPNGWVVARDVEKAGAGKSSPLAAKMAAEAGLDPASLGKDGRVMKGDVAGALAAAGQPGRERRAPITQMRRVIGQRMLASTTSIPAVNYFLDADMSAVNKMRAAFNARLAKSTPGVKLSVNDIMMKLCAKLLLEHPLLNGSVEEDAFVMHDYVNIGFAVALPGGLLVPNIKEVETKSLTAIARERADLVEYTRKGALSPDQMTGATFTISNLGMMGVDSFTPIINPPEVAILGLGATSDKPVAVDGEVVVRPIATLCLTADHRLADGADAAAFLAKLKELIESPDLFLL